MQWHLTPAWGGYAWDAGRYPDAPALLDWLHARGLATGANFHDADGVTAAANPDTFAAFCAAVGADPAVRRWHAVSARARACARPIDMCGHVL